MNSADLEILLQEAEKNTPQVPRKYPASLQHVPHMYCTSKEHVVYIATTAGRGMVEISDKESLS